MTDFGFDSTSGGGGGGNISGSGTANEIASFNGATSITSLSTTTYPNLTELSYVKGVTSALQTQLNGKQATLTNPVTGTGTNNEIAAFNSTGSTITSLTTATYPSLTELSYVKGVTSAIQTQINTKVTSGGALGTPSSGTLTNCTGLPTSGITGYQGYSLQIGVPSLNPADSTTYYFGAPNAAVGNTTDGAFALTIPKFGTIKAVAIDIYTGGALGSSETSTWSVRVNTTNTTISSTVTTNATTNRFSNTSMSVAVVAGDILQIVFASPAYATNPTTVRGNITVYIE